MTDNTQPEALRDARWYMVDKDGMATLCTDREDAEQEAKDANMAWPHTAPHRAVQLVEVGTAAAELHRQHARIAELESRVQELGTTARENRSRRIAELEAQLDSIRAGGVSGPLMGQPQSMPDLSALTERGAKAWAGVDAQELREGADMSKEREDLPAFYAWLRTYEDEVGALDDDSARAGFIAGRASLSANAPAPSEHIKEPYTLAEVKAKIASNDYSAEMLLQHAMLLLDSASLSANAGGELVYQARYQKGFWQNSSRERCEYLQNPENTCAEDWETRILYTRPPTSAEGVEP